MKKRSVAQRKRDLQEFETAFLYWCNRLGVTGYTLRVIEKDLDKTQAQLWVNHIGKVATGVLNSHIEKCDWCESPAVVGKHEAIHLLLARLTWLGACRYLEDTDIEEEEEFVVNRLMVALKNEEP